jgi:hypothetical protein
MLSIKKDKRAKGAIRVMLGPSDSLNEGDRPEVAAT